MKTNPKPKTQTEEGIDETIENLYAFKAGASCGLYSMDQEFWENLGEKANPTQEKTKNKNHKPTIKK
ncbi:MAG: hypothetical protein ACETWM_12825 [Candidatus Lokiarchaeia archaeon]